MRFRNAVWLWDHQGLRMGIGNSDSWFQFIGQQESMSNYSGRPHACPSP